jgi:hypothetical protein
MARNRRRIANRFVAAARFAEETRAEHAGTLHEKCAAGF